MTDLLEIIFSFSGSPYGDAHFEFMREIDTPCPDYSLRAALRAKVIAARNRRR